MSIQVHIFVIAPREWIRRFQTHKAARNGSTIPSSATMDSLVEFVKNILSSDRGMEQVMKVDRAPLGLSRRETSKSASATPRRTLGAAAASSPDLQRLQSLRAATGAPMTKWHGLRHPNQWNQLMHLLH